MRRAILPICLVALLALPGSAGLASGLQIIEAPLPAISTTRVAFVFEAPDGGTVELSIDGVNRRGQPLGSFIHIADVDFGAVEPTVFYRVFRLREASGEPVLSDSGFVGSVSVEHPAILTAGLPGLPDALLVPSVSFIPLDAALRPGDLEEIRLALGLPTLDLEDPRGLGVKGIDVVLPEPGPLGPVGVGIMLLLGKRRISRSARGLQEQPLGNTA